MSLYIWLTSLLRIDVTDYKLEKSSYPKEWIYVRSGGNMTPREDKIRAVIGGVLLI